MTVAFALCASYAAIWHERDVMDIQFGEYRLLRRERQLLGPSGTVEIGARPFDILLMLLERANSVVSKNYLLDAVWPGLVVEENTLQVHVSALRKLFGNSLIRTVHGRGYKYAGPEPRYDEAMPPGLNSLERVTGKDRAGSIGGEARNATSVAVLPFSSLSDDGDTELFAEGLAEDLITELARYRHLLVIGHRLSSPYRGRRSERVATGRELGVDFIIDGSVRIAGDAVRVVVQLVDTETGAHAWGERFDRKLVDILAVQDEIVDAVIGRLAFKLDQAAERQRRRDPTSSSSAYTQFLRARTAWRSGDEVLALSCAERAVEIDPGYGRAHAYVGLFRAYSLFTQWAGLGEQETVRLARGSFERALATDRSDPFVLQRAALGYLMLGEPHDALRYAVAAAEDCARDSEILITHGMILAYCGQYDEGVAMLERALKLGHSLPPGCVSALSEGRYLQGDYSGSLALLNMVVDPPYYLQLIRAANLVQLGDQEQAGRIIAEGPIGFDTARFARALARMCGMPRDAERWLESFRLAGVKV